MLIEPLHAITTTITRLRPSDLLSGNARSATRVHCFVLSHFRGFRSEFRCRPCTLCIVVQPIVHPHRAHHRKVGIYLESHRLRRGRTKTKLGFSTTSNVQPQYHADSRDRLDQAAFLSRMSRIRLNPARVCKVRWQSSSILQSHESHPMLAVIFLALFLCGT